MDVCEVRILDDQWARVVAVEFLGDFGEWRGIEYETALGPCRCGRNVGLSWRRSESGRGCYGDLLAGGEDDRAVRAQPLRKILTLPTSLAPILSRHLERAS